MFPKSYRSILMGHISNIFGSKKHELPESESEVLPVRGESQALNGENSNQAGSASISQNGTANNEVEYHNYDTPILIPPSSKSALFRSQALRSPLGNSNRHTARRGSNASTSSTTNLLSNSTAAGQAGQTDPNDTVTSPDNLSSELVPGQLWATTIPLAPRIEFFVGRDKAFKRVSDEITTISIGEMFERPESTCLKRGGSKNLKIWGVSPDGKQLAAIKRGMLDRIWLIDSATGKSRLKLFFESGGYSGKAAFSPDSRYLVAMNAYKKLKLWDARTGKSMGTVRDVQRCYKISISSNSCCLFVGIESGVIQVRDLKTLKHLFSITSSEAGPEARILQFAASPTEMKMAYVTANGKVGIIHVEERIRHEWDIPGTFLTPGSAGKIQYSNHPRDDHIAISDDGRFLSLLHRRSLFVWETGTGRLSRREDDFVTAQVIGSNKLLTLTRHDDGNVMGWLLTMHSLV